MRLTIRSPVARGLDLPTTRPVETAGGVLRTVPVVLLDVHTEEGVTGRAYVRLYSPVLLGRAVQLFDGVAELLRGSSAAPAVVARDLHRRFRLAGTTGLVGVVLAGIDMALWDARARACAVPLVTLLGGEPGPVPAYAGLRSMAARVAVAEAEEALGLGRPRGPDPGRAGRGARRPRRDPGPAGQRRRVGRGGDRPDPVRPGPGWGVTGRA